MTIKDRLVYALGANYYPAPRPMTEGIWVHAIGAAGMGYIEGDSVFINITSYGTVTSVMFHLGRHKLFEYPLTDQWNVINGDRIVLPLKQIAFMLREAHIVARDTLNELDALRKEFK